MRQLENRAADGCTSRTAPALDAIRLEQFLVLQRDLLLATDDADELPARLVQWVAVFLGVHGAAVCAVEDGCYRVLGAYGVGLAYRERYDGMRLRDSELAAVLTRGRPLVLDEVDGDTPVRTIVLPFGTGDDTGALHVVVAESAPLGDDGLELARALAGLTGVALANARGLGRLARVARLKGDALTTMAHDLRSPLNALIGYANLLGEDAFGPLSAEQREVAATLERQALELVDLLGATLDVARLETGRLPLRVEEFALGDVVGSLRAGTFAAASRSGALVWAVPPDLPPLRTDRVKVKEIVQNLVDNALKHAAGAAVSVEAGLAPERAVTRITVRDAGRGIGADVLPHLFEPFRPGQGASRGTGFGLYIVRCFTEALGGRVAARSDGTGTAITVELPLDAPA